MKPERNVRSFVDFAGFSKHAIVLQAQDSGTSKLNKANKGHYMDSNILKVLPAKAWQDDGVRLLHNRVAKGEATLRNTDTSPSLWRPKRHL